MNLSENIFSLRNSKSLVLNSIEGTKTGYKYIHACSLLEYAAWYKNQSLNFYHKF